MMRPAMLAVRPGFRAVPDAPFCADDTVPSMATASSRRNRDARTFIGTTPLSVPPRRSVRPHLGCATQDTAVGRERLYGRQGSLLAVGGWWLVVRLQRGATNIGA